MFDRYRYYFRKNNHTKVIGFDATDEEKGAIDKSEDSPYLATVMQYPEKMGEIAVQTIRDYVIPGKQLPEDQKYMNAGVGLYTYGGKIITIIRTSPRRGTTTASSPETSTKR